MISELQGSLHIPFGRHRRDFRPVGKIFMSEYANFIAAKNEKLGSVYLVKLDVDDSNPNINVMSGLSGAVEVKIGTQSIMRYFLDPIVKGFGNSMKEK